ncbi:unnamed protein product [Trichogramma brassicae]|uniref:Uncharacterized protein n=1 Tax=Trichogramma brassicae TaxID=86971 RepID=A0A6H5HXQ7_9HYME|nr:unnamed protein product [Trichogramma brassicae]
MRLYVRTKIWTKIKLLLTDQTVHEGSKRFPSMRDKSDEKRTYTKKTRLLPIHRGPSIKFGLHSHRPPPVGIALRLPRPLRPKFFDIKPPCFDTYTPCPRWSHGYPVTRVRRRLDPPLIWLYFHHHPRPRRVHQRFLLYQVRADLD